MGRKWFGCMAALAVMVVAGCQSRDCPPPPRRALSIGCIESNAPFELDRGDWMVSRRTAVWNVMKAREGRPPVRVGYLVERTYRQVRGGPEYTMYDVTTLNRREKIGRIDQLGRAWRYEPQHNAGFEEFDEGISDLERGVADIFRTKRTITLEKTTERRLAFEVFDRDDSGFLEVEEVARHGDRLRRADTDGDSRVDFEEFDKIPTL